MCIRDGKKHDSGFPLRAVQYCLAEGGVGPGQLDAVAFYDLSLIHISEPTRLLSISYAVFCLKKKNRHISITTHRAASLLTSHHTAPHVHLIMPVTTVFHISQ